MRIPLFLLVLFHGMIAPLFADDFSELAGRNWHQWRGPNANGANDSADPPLEWSETKNIKWKAPVHGEGSSTPIVWEDRIISLSAEKTDKVKEGAPPAPEAPPAEGGGRRRFGGPPPTNYYNFWVLAHDRATGKELWRTKVTEEVPHEAGHNTNSFASSSPITDGQRIYAHFGSRGLYCLDMDGKILWKKEFGKMKTAASFGEGATPALANGVLVVPWDHEEQSFAVALDSKTGDEKWRVDRPEKTTWATPLVTEFNGAMQVIMHGKERVRSYNLQDGQVIWECGGQASNPIPSPVRYQDNVICMTGFRGFAIVSIPLASKGDVTDTDKITWKAGDAAPYVPSPVLYQDQLYFTKSNNGILVSRKAADGAVVIAETRLPGVEMVYASPVASRGKIYLTSRDGKTLVFTHGDKFELLATNALDETIDGSLALVGSEVFARGRKSLYCISNAK